MAISMFDQITVSLACGHRVVVGRIKSNKWTCDACDTLTDFTIQPFCTALQRDRDAADQIDKKEMARGQTIERHT